MAIRKQATIKLTFDSYYYLRNKQHEERSESGRALNKETIKRQFDSNHPNGYFLATNGSFGGCKGSPVNAWEQGRWTSWKLEQLKEMLDNAGLPWEDGEEIETIEI